MLKYGFKAYAEKIALQFRAELGLKAHDPLTADRLAEHLKVRLMTPYDIPGLPPEILHTLLVSRKRNWSAAIFLCEGDRYIIYNPTTSELRRESDLMHELSHAICGHELKGPAEALHNLILRVYDLDQEDEAAWLGGCLQLPQKALFHHFKLRKLSEEKISTLFKASSQMVTFRLNVSGVRYINLNKGKR